MRNLIASCSVGKIDDKVVLDISGIEDNYGQVDMPIATIGGGDKIVLLQLDGIMSRKEFSQALKLGLKGCAEIHEMQKEALRKKYSKGEENE